MKVLVLMEIIRSTPLIVATAAVVGARTVAWDLIQNLTFSYNRENCFNFLLFGLF